MNTIEAMKQALAAGEKFITKVHTGKAKSTEAYNDLTASNLALREAIEREETQTVEAVAWMDKSQGAFSFMYGTYGPTWTPLFTHPVPMVDREEANTVHPCKGKNCGTKNPKFHSSDCFAEYEVITGHQKPVGFVRAYALKHLTKPGQTVINHEPLDADDIPLFTRPPQHRAIK